jgi:hypothetical protein
VYDTLQCTNINLDEFCREQDIEAYAVRMNLSSLTVHIIFILRSPTMGTFYIPYTLFSVSYITTIQIIIFSDFNINYLNDDKKKSKIDNL